MIKKIILSNYRCYEEHEIDFKDITIVVGKNNAGKSTLIEALRLVSLVSSRIKTGKFKYPPKWTQLPKRQVGISPSLERIEFAIKNIIHQYNDPPARIVAFFSNNEKIEVCLNDSGNIFASAVNSKGEIISSRADATELKNVNISILPQISPLLEDEKALDKPYVKSNIFSALASRHFRNQLSYLNEYYSDFKKIAEESWEGLRLIELTKAQKLIHVTNPSLLVQEGGFATEIGSMGHGLQMWLQTMWFIARTSPTSAIILDEPDVYMHADLQRKLIRILKGQFSQVIVATHSLEIMSEVEPENILIIDRRQSESKFATDIPQIQKIIYNDIGSIHNLELAKLWSSRKFLMVEGNDISILKRFQNTLHPKSSNPIDSIPSSDIGGWGGWNYAIGSKYVLKNAGDESIVIYCILDSDYHIPPEKEKRYKEANKYGISLHIWKMKEIENYLIIPAAITRLIYRKKPKSKSTLSEELISQQIEAICEDLKSELIDDFASEIGKYYRRDNKIIDFTDNDKELKYETKNINKVARKHVNKHWEDKISIVPGKKLLKELNIWLAEKYKTNIGTNELANEIALNEINSEMRHVIRSIELVKKIKYEA